MTTEIYYRAEDTHYGAGVDECGNFIIGAKGSMSIRMWEIPVLRRTPYGVVLAVANGSRNYRFVHEGRVKRFAHPTKAEALAALVARRERQASIYAARAERAQLVADVAKKMLAAGETEFYGSPHLRAAFFTLSGKTPTRVILDETGERN